MADSTPEPEPEPEPPRQRRGSEELFQSRAPEWETLQWLEGFLPGGSQGFVCKAEMARKGLTSRSLHYAEVDLNFLALFLRRAHARWFPQLLPGPRAGGGVFADIGAGLGKSVLCAAMALPLRRCVGVEIMEDMVAQSQHLLERWHASGRHTSCCEVTAW
jgi:hypothetical protein